MAINAVRAMSNLRMNNKYLEAASILATLQSLNYREPYDSFLGDGNSIASKNQKAWQISFRLTGQETKVLAATAGIHRPTRKQSERHQRIDK